MYLNKYLFSIGDSDILVSDCGLKLTTNATVSNNFKKCLKPPPKPSCCEQINATYERADSSENDCSSVVYGEWRKCCRTRR